MSIGRLIPDLSQLAPQVQLRPLVAVSFLGLGPVAFSARGEGSVMKEEVKRRKETDENAMKVVIRFIGTERERSEAQIDRRTRPNSPSRQIVTVVPVSSTQLTCHIFSRMRW